MGDSTILEVKGLKKYFPITKGLWQRKIGDIKAVDGIDFILGRGKTLGLVGESGCGKTTTGRCILQLEKPTAGDVIFDGVNLCQLKGKSLRSMRKRIQVIFSGPL